MVETSLAEIFSGDVPRIDNMMIVLDQVAEVDESDAMGWSAQLLGEYLVGFNLPSTIINKKWKEWFPRVNFVLIVRAEDGFRVEHGDLPEHFQGTFFWLIRGKRAHDTVEEIRTVL